MPNKWRTIISWVLHTTVDFTVDEGKGRLNSSRDKKLRQAPQKEGGEILCDPGWCVHKSGVQNKWDDNRHTHTHRECVPFVASDQRFS